MSAPPLASSLLVSVKSLLNKAWSDWFVALGTASDDHESRIDAAEAAISGLGTISTQDADAVNIDGGAIDGTAIGQGTASSGAFTTLQVSDTATITKQGDGVTLLVLNSERAWSLVQTGTGESSAINLRSSVDQKEFRVQSPSPATVLGVYVNDAAAAHQVYVGASTALTSAARDETPYDNSGNASAWALAQGGWCSFARYQGPAAIFNRLNNDGSVINIAQDGTVEGFVGVSGSTVSVTGAHLSRWSQWDGHEHFLHPEELRGTVLSNRDAMCEWLAHEWIEIDAGTRKHELYDGPLPHGTTWVDDDGVWHEIVREDNEQLNRTAVSDVPGDRRVAGVFQEYDLGDIYAPYDFTLAMTGDFVIRIGAGVTVQSGDLLESAGDGTARPQAGPDFPSPTNYSDWREWASAHNSAVRSYLAQCVTAGTIGKVNSTEAQTTYEDGSRLIPCVLR